MHRLIGRCLAFLVGFNRGCDGNTILNGVSVLFSFGKINGNEKGHLKYIGSVPKVPLELTILMIKNLKRLKKECCPQ